MLRVGGLPPLKENPRDQDLQGLEMSRYHEDLVSYANVGALLQ
jgi:hypothetical protein